LGKERLLQEHSLTFQREFDGVFYRRIETMMFFIVVTLLWARQDPEPRRSQKKVNRYNSLFCDRYGSGKPKPVFGDLFGFDGVSVSGCHTST